MRNRNQFLISNRMAKSLTLNIEPEGAFFPVPQGDKVAVTDLFTSAPLTIEFTNSDKGEPIVSIWPGDGAVKVEHDGIDVLELLQKGMKARSA